MKNIVLLILILVLSAITMYFIIKPHLPRDVSINNTISKHINMNSKESEIYEFTIFSWIPYWDYANALDEVVENIVGFSGISPFIYVLNDDGLIQLKISEADLTNTMNYDVLKIIPTISNEFDPERVSTIINDEELMEGHVKEISDIVKNNDFDGIDIDYEYLEAKDKDAFTKFIQELSIILKATKKTLIVTLHPKTNEKGEWSAEEAQDWEEISKYADFVRIMAYDYHWSTSEPGPIAPLSWVKDVGIYANDIIPEDKLIMGIGYYGYDWPPEGKAKSITLVEANNLAEKYNAEVIYDTVSHSPYFTYEAGDGTHTVWFENEKSIEHKRDVAQKYYRGITVWRSGGIPQELLESL